MIILDVFLVEIKVAARSGGSALRGALCDSLALHNTEVQKDVPRSRGMQTETGNRNAAGMLGYMGLVLASNVGC